jgi:RNA polymerase sigma-70 factor (ECF subfamily)
MDDQKIIALYEAHARELVGWFARRTGNPALALDLLSVTFLKAFEQRRHARAQTDSQCAAWLYRIAGNTLIDHARSGASEQRALRRARAERRPLDEQETATIEQLAASSELQQRVLEALDTLSPEQRAALDLRVIEERPYQEVSHMLGVSEAAVRARVSRGLRALRRAAQARKEHP